MPVTTYSTVNGSIVSEHRGGVDRDYGRDGLGSTAALYDSSGAKTDEFRYWPYGEEAMRTGSTDTPFRYVGTLGYYRDSSSYTYVRARFLLPRLARWLTRDPLWPQERAYGYVEGRPAKWVDTSGMGCPPNPCSSLPGVTGACIALLCSMKNAVDMLNAFKKAVKDPNLRKLIERILKDMRKAPKYSPEDCCKAAGAGGKPPPLKDVRNLPQLIAYLCSHGGATGFVPPKTCSETTGSNTECRSCCEMYPNDTPARHNCYTWCADLDG